MSAVIGKDAVPAEPACRDEVRAIGGVGVHAATGDSAARFLSHRLDAGVATSVAFLNAHCVNLAHADENYRRCLRDFLVLPDGIGLDVASRILFGRTFPENLNGTDFVPRLLRELKRPMRVALLGSEPGVPELAADRFAADMPQHVFLPVSHGFFQPGAETEAVLARLREAKADIVLVALGVPRQELFIARFVTQREATLAIAVGALLDFTAGKVARAPPLLRHLRMEWLYRLMIEPKRLWKRYILGNPIFLMRVLREKWHNGWSRDTAL